MSLKNKMFKYNQKDYFRTGVVIKNPCILQEMADKLREDKYILPYPILYIQTERFMYDP